MIRLHVKQGKIDITVEDESPVSAMQKFNFIVGLIAMNGDLTIENIKEQEQELLKLLATPERSSNSPEPAPPHTDN